MLKPRNNSVDCDYANPPKPGHVCRIDIDSLGACTAVNAFGYNSSKPCVFLKLNRVIISPIWFDLDFHYAPLN